MITIKKISVFCLFLFTFALYAQDKSSIQLDYANNLFKSQQYFDAITEYKRLLFFNSSNDYDFTVNMQIGQCYKAGALFDNAVKFFSIAEKNATNSDQKYSAKIQQVRVNILRKTTDRALDLLNDIEKSGLFVDKKDSINYWRGWTYMIADNWHKASESFGNIASNHDLKKLCDGVLNKKVSVTFAKVISYILPGSGQIYTGNYFSGIMSLGYNILFGYLSINSFAENRIFDGIATGSLLWLRFYRGNIENAKNFAEEKNREIANNTLRYLQNNYQGTKP